ncbi:MAG: hypothetical protein LUC23_05995 [Prevotellaceae bacterium]|nr:hypothetical protein [Prevotellaceae bacterium]
MNTRILYRLLPLVALPIVCLLAGGCINNLDDAQTTEQTPAGGGEAPSITLQYNAVTLSADGFHGTIAISANVDYRITGTASYDWFTFERRGEGVYIELDKNDTEEMRGIILYIENEAYGLEETLTVIQEAGSAVQGSGSTDGDDVDYIPDDGYDDEASTATHRCMAITKNGTQCKRNAMEGSDYCWQHQPS